MRTFDYGDSYRVLIDKLNDLFSIGMPRAPYDANDPNSAPADQTLGRWIVSTDNGCCLDIGAALTLSPQPECMRDGFAFFVYAYGGTCTIDLHMIPGASFKNAGGTTKTVMAGNAALISCDGTQWRIFRMVAS